MKQTDVKYRIGIDIGGTNIECAIVNPYDSHNVPIYVHRKYPKGADLDSLCSLIKDCVCELMELCCATFCNIQMVGIAMPGSLDVINGVVINAYNLGFHNAPIISTLKAIMPELKFKLINDADAATLGELKYGALRGAKSACLITLGTGVGAGVIINNELYIGGRNRGTELGHMTLKKDGELCSCGNRGCIETLCSATYIEKQAKERYKSDSQITAKQVFEAAANGNEIAKSIFDDYVDNLSTALATYIVLLDPEIIALGGGVSLAGDQLLVPLRIRTEEKSFFYPIANIVAAQLWDKAGAIGAAFV